MGSTLNIDTVLYNDKQIIHCANCKEQGVDLQERLLDYCWQTGCPGCDVCGNYIDKDELIETCTECIREHNGLVGEGIIVLISASTMRTA